MGLDHIAVDAKMDLAVRDSVFFFSRNQMRACVSTMCLAVIAAPFRTAEVFLGGHFFFGARKLAEPHHLGACLGLGGIKEGDVDFRIATAMRRLAGIKNRGLCHPAVVPV